MEVHHHPTVAKKNFKEYFLEFLMIFLAVTMGFVAENLREHISDSQHEKNLAKELYVELRDDSTVIANFITARLAREADMDYLARYFKDSSLTQLPREFYPAYTTSLYLINSYAFEPKDGILSQLQSSGALGYFKNIRLQKLLGEIAVCIYNIRFRNSQEYQYFANPVKPFILKHLDFGWINELRKEDADPESFILGIINRYRQGNKTIPGKILNVSTFDRIEAVNMINFYKQMVVSTRTLQLKEYVVTNQKILAELRNHYNL